MTLLRRHQKTSALYRKFCDPIPIRCMTAVRIVIDGEVLSHEVEQHCNRRKEFAVIVLFDYVYRWNCVLVDNVMLTQ